MNKKSLLSIIIMEYKLNCGNKSVVYNLLYPNYCYKYLFYLRIYEYAISNKHNPCLYLLRVILKFKINKWSQKAKIEFPTFTIGHGCRINHTVGGIIVNSRARVGKNAYISNGVIIGQSSIYEPYSVPMIGNNVHLAPNCKIFGRITIGDNVIIGTDCIVRYSVPSNSCVVGNPAKIVRLNGNKCNIILSEYDSTIG